MSVWSVAKCCSASVSVGAMSAAWRPCSTARSIACSATTVLPEPTSPMSSRCIGRSRARSASISAIAVSWSGVGSNGSRSVSHSWLSVGGSVSGSACVIEPALGAQPQLDGLVEQQLVEREPAPAGLAVADVRGDDRVGARREALLAPQTGREQLGDLVRRGEVLADQGEDLRGRDALRRRVRRGRVADRRSRPRSARGG